ncbi:GNAT family N-acetyltransferase [Fulvimarina sp. 2208YS6-2-32]|uniref:GNAT family N-acetyltransferase n=1 Tax=Fulvimarina uroteuthidis TaxID=3098149 RepID=A0ABU5HZJ8_9HYPH|nr:GNAT family N-acetyltransferase [Fulvimarina sp. 2208YS6-2-32]MDY8108205.1 GNAT family N-acetyltransferase [Fulvimarina sp. 2208YS6-2-32]
MTCEIRPLAPLDKDQWRASWTNYLGFYETSVEDEVYETSFARMMSGERGEFRGLVAVRDGRLVGLAHYLFHRHGWRIADACYLQDLWVEPDQRGAGIARALIEAVYAAADAHGCAKIYWMTQETNAVARCLYDRIGVRTGFIEYRR